jgi:hypothetical protein
MDALYKYLSAEGVEELLGGGRVRIGTLHDYRNTCNHREEVADRKEGSRRIVVDVSPPDADPARDVERAVHDHGLDAHARADLRVEAHADAVVVEERSPNLYLFSASLRCDRELMYALDYEACVRIAEPDNFFAMLTRSMTGMRRFLGYRAVVYEDPRHPRPRDAGIHPAFFKSADFSHQAEVRALWEPEAPGIEPVVVECRGAAELCELCLSR